MVILSPNAIINLKDSSSFYFDFKEYLKDGLRGQTPFTPPLGILNQLKVRLRELKDKKKILKQRKDKALYLRQNLKNLPLKPYVEQMSLCISSFGVDENTKASELINTLEKDYNIILRHSGGKFKDSLIRISNMGKIRKKDIDKLVFALHEYFKRK